jgi:hypothetical protein
MRNIYLFIFVLFAFASSQGIDTVWTRTYGGSNNDIAYSVCPTNDGGYIIAGYTSSLSSGPQDVYIVKTNSTGDTVWTKKFGGASWDGAHYIYQTQDSGYLIAAYTESYGAGGKDVYLIRLDDQGGTVWMKTYGGTNQDVAMAICETHDNGYIISGYRDGPTGWEKGDLWLLKIDDTGDTAWTKTYGGTGEDCGTSIRRTPDNGFIIAGYNSYQSAGGKDLWLLKTDESGDTVWTKTYGGPLEDVGYGVNLTADSGYIVTGYINGTGAWTAGDLWLLKTNADGDSTWTKTYGTFGEDFGFDVYQTYDGGYIISGEVGFNYYTDVWLVRTDSNGDTLWTRTYGGTNTDASLSLAKTADNAYIIAGHTASFGAGNADMYLIKTTQDASIRELNHAVVRMPFETSIVSGNIILPAGEACKVIDISGRITNPKTLSLGVYFVEINGLIARKVIKIK